MKLIDTHGSREWERSDAKLIDLQEPAFYATSSLADINFCFHLFLHNIVICG